ncbi:unnamed protein product [Mucor hiemalis]
MTTIPERPQSLNELPNIIQELQHTPFQLDQYGEEYKRGIGLSGTSHSTLHFHPEALRLELKDQQEHFHHLKHNYIDRLTKQKFLECTLQEPPTIVTLNNLKNIEKENDEKLSQINTLSTQKEAIGQTIKSTIITVETEREVLNDMIDETEKTIGTILTMEEELHRIQSKLKNRNELSVEEAEEILVRQTDYLTQLARENDEQRDILEEHKWDVLQKEKKLEETRLFANQMLNEAKQAIRAKESQLENIDIQYREYKQAIDLYNRLLFGAKSIDFSSKDVIHVTFEEKFKGAVLHVYINYDIRKVAHLAIDGPEIDLDSTLKLAQRSSVNDGVKTAILETLNCLKKL